MNIRLLMLSLMTGLTIGNGVSKTLYENSESPNDPCKFNAYYDLACLYGDSNGDNVLTDDEYLKFDINSLAPKKELMEDTDFKFLGFNPFDEKDMGFYVFTDASLSKYDSVYLNYVNGVTISTSSEESKKYSDDVVVISNAKFVNEYHGSSGYFSKFNITDYTPKILEGNMRIAAKNISCYVGSEKKEEFDIKAGGELLYNSSAYYTADQTTNPISLYFGTKTYSITGDCYEMLAKLEEKTSPSGNVFFIPTGTNAFVTKAKEIFYYFFSFDDASFNPDNITSVSYSCQLINFEQTSYYGKYDLPTASSGSNEPRIYSGLYKDADSGHLNVPLSKYESKQYNYFSKLKSKEPFSATTTQRTEEYTQTDTEASIIPWNKYQPIIRKYKTSTIFSTSDYENQFSGDDYSNFRTFISNSISSGAEDNHQYKWAYAVENEDWIREVSSQNSNYWTGAAYQGGRYPTETVSETVTNCHEIDQLVTLMMHTVTDGVGCDIKVFNNPASVKKVFMVGYPAPSLMDFLINDISTWLKNNQWIWIAVAGIALLLLIVLSIVFPPVFKAIAAVLKVIINVLYLLLVWWWLATICKLTGNPIPSINLFGKRR